MNKNEVNISGRPVGGNHPCFIVAELSANHMKQYDITVKTIKEAKKTGADAIKFQTYTPDTITIDCRNEAFRIHSSTPWDVEFLYDLYWSAYMPWEWHDDLKKVAENEGLIWFSMPFDNTAVDFLEDLNSPAYNKVCL